MSDNRCKHCHQPIRLHHMSLGPTWYHQHPGAASMDGTYQVCRASTIAEPDNAEVSS